MSVWKRRWTLKDGTESESWIADYYDADGDRHIKSFKTKKAATEYHAKVTLDLKDGVHVAVRKSVSVKDAAESWLRSADNDGLERATIKQYREHVDRHIVPIIGTLKLSNLNIPTVRNFEDKLREKGGIGAATVRKVMTSLGSILADAQENGLCAHNAVRDLSKKRRRGKKERVEQRHKGKLKVGVHIPTLEEARAVIANAKARWRPLLIVATFTGLRASELRGLRWCDIDLEGRKVHVRHEIGSPKSESSARSVPFGTFVANTLRAWRLLRESHKLDSDLVFGNGNGRPESFANIINRGLIPAQMAAGITVKIGDKVKAKYTGMHALRHFYASWCINRKEEGGLALPAKVVQERLGHSSVVLTLNVYSHLFPSADDASEIDAAELALVG